jgi:diguanylate cyclase (GGDEF)-like protein
MFAALVAMVLAVTGAYIGFFHSAAALLANSVIAVSTAAIIAYRLSQYAGPTTALAVFWLTWLITIALPVGVRGTTHAMRQYAIQSDHDALTGLLNRRGFANTINRHLTSRPSRRSIDHLIVMMLDLDDFKRLNDTHGHATGDAVLKRVAGLLVQYSPEDAAICRAGGEEFLVAFTSPTDDVSTVTADLCAAIGDWCPNITASIGVASAELQSTSTDAQTLTDLLVNAADAAMYEAKRRGGNGVHIADDSTLLDPPGRS